MPMVKVKASPGQEKLIQDLLRAHNWEISDTADILIQERGMPFPEKKLVVIYDPEDLTPFIRFLSECSAGPERSSVFAGRKHNTFEPVRTEDILYFRADGNYVYCHTLKGVYEIKQKLYEIERAAGYRHFLRVNKSFIVNIMKVREIIPWFGGRFLLKFDRCEDRIEVSRNFVRSFKDYLGM